MKKAKKLYSNSTYLYEVKRIKIMVFCALMAALSIVLSNIATIQVGTFIKIGFSEIPNRIVEFLFGPIIGGIFGGILDIFKYLVKPTGIFFVGFTLNAILSGLIYGVFLYNKPVKVYRIMLAEFIVKVIVNCILNTLWLSILYGKGFMSLITVRIIKNLIMWPIDSIILFVLLTYVEKRIKPIIRNKK